MGWASDHIDKLKAGQTVQFRPHGHSMTGRINSGQLCTVEPYGDRKPEPGDIVLCKVRCHQYLHLIKKFDGRRYQIGNNRGRINGWVYPDAIFGRCVKVQD